MRFVLALLVAILITACGSVKGPILDTDGNQVGEIKLLFGGKGCGIIEVANGRTSAVVKQDGMSNVLGGTLRFLGDIVGGVFGNSQIRDSEIGPAGEGCEGLFVSGNDPEDELPVQELRLNITTSSPDEGD